MLRSTAACRLRRCPLRGESALVTEGSIHVKNILDPFPYIIPKNRSPALHLGRLKALREPTVGRSCRAQGKAPNIRGPYASYAREEGADSRTEKLLPIYQAQRLDSGQRVLTAQADVWAESAEQRLIFVQHELVGARNLKVEKEDLLQTQFAQRRGSRKHCRVTAQALSIAHCETQFIQKKSAKQLSSTLETLQHHVRSGALHARTGKGQRGSMGQLFTLSAVHRMVCGFHFHSLVDPRKWGSCQVLAAVFISTCHRPASQPPLFPPYRQC